MSDRQIDEEVEMSEPTAEELAAKFISNPRMHLLRAQVAAAIRAAEQRGAERERKELAQDAARWRCLVELGTCYHDGPGFICDRTNSRIWFHETDDKSHSSLQDYVDAAIRARGGEKP